MGVLYAQGPLVAIEYAGLRAAAAPVLESILPQLSKLGVTTILTRFVTGTKAILSWSAKNPLKASIIALAGGVAYGVVTNKDAAFQMADSFFQGTEDILENLPIILITLGGGIGGYALASALKPTSGPAVKLGAGVLGAGAGFLFSETYFKPKEHVYPATSSDLTTTPSVDPDDISRDPNHDSLSAAIPSWDISLLTKDYGIYFFGFPIITEHDYFERISYDVRNTSSIDGTFWCGLSIEDLSRSVWSNNRFPYFLDVPAKEQWIASGQTTKIDFGRIDLTDSFEGNYNVHMAVWAGYDTGNGLMVEPRYDRIVVPRNYHSHF